MTAYRGILSLLAGSVSIRKTIISVRLSLCLIISSPSLSHHPSSLSSILSSSSLSLRVEGVEDLLVSLLSLSPSPSPLFYHSSYSTFFFLLLFSLPFPLLCHASWCLAIHVCSVTLYSSAWLPSCKHVPVCIVCVWLWLCPCYAVPNPYAMAFFMSSLCMYHVTCA